MAETIETFVARLRAEGVEAGKQAAEKAKTDAEAAAAEILRRAEEKAAKIVADAEKQAEGMRAAAKSDLELAARDAVLGLRQTLTGVLRAILARSVRAELADAAFLRQLIHDIAMEYARSDREGARKIAVNVQPEMRKKLADWALGEAHKAATAPHASIDLRGTLAQAGFEFRMDGGTIEITEDAVVEKLRDLVGTSLREILDAMSRGAAK